MALRRVISILMLAFLGTSCEETVEVSLPFEDAELIAVEAIITNENINHWVRLSLPYQQINGRSVGVRGAVVTITDGTSTIALSELDSGKYVTPKMRFVSGATYTLTINYNGKQYSATDKSVPVEPLNPFSVTKSDDGNRLNLFNTGSQPNYIVYYIDWTTSAACTAPACRAQLIHYDLKTVDSNEIFKPGKEDFFFPSPATVVRRKFSVSPAYRSYLRSMLSETEWRGSVFDIQRDNAATNLSDGAIGFFGVCTVLSDTVKIQ